MRLRSDNILIIFAKHPRPGEVKTRLAERSGNKSACDIYSAFLTTTVSRMRNFQGFDLRIDFSPRTIDAQRYFSTSFPGLPLAPQEGKDLGAKMNHSFVSAFEDGYRRVCIIGSDSPDLPLQIIETAFDKLEKNNLVLGPSGDGGYYLVGMNAPCPGIFEGVEWSTPKVLEQTLERAKALELSLHALEPWSDVDSWDDLLYLTAKLEKKIPLAEPLKHLRDALSVMMKDNL